MICTMRVFAAEPHVSSPVAMAFDEMVVFAEMGGCPMTRRAAPSNSGKYQGTVCSSSRRPSSPENSRFRQRHALERWRPRVGRPDLLFLKDTDGDGKADLRQVVFTGFAEADAASVQRPDLQSG